MLRRVLRACWLIALALVVLAGCSLFPSTPAPTAAPTQAPQPQILIDNPQQNAVIASPFELRGQTNYFPSGASLRYRVLDSSGAEAASGSIQLGGAPGQGITFSLQVSYQTALTGAGRVEIFDIDAATSGVIASASVPVTLNASFVPPTPTPAPPTPTPAPPVPQQIFIDTPAPDTTIGSPVVITGRTATFPTNGQLFFRFVDSANQQLGAGNFAVQGSAGQPTTFNAQLTFNAPANGGPVRVDVFDQSASGVLASASLNMWVDPPQSLVIDSPPSGTTVGSPIVITGRTARFPFQGNLGYTIFGPDGRQLGGGTFPVLGGSRQPGTFNASLRFILPIDGGDVRVGIFDQDAQTGVTVASTSLTVRVAPQPQQIFIDTPPPNVDVSSPVVITGRTVRFPFQGSLGFRVTDGVGILLGQGAFPTNRTFEGGSTFSASINFSLPSGGGQVRVELFDQNAVTGVIVASSSIDLVVPPPLSQQITIETPAPDTVVGSPVVVTGRAALYPNGGVLSYRAIDPNGAILGSGQFPIFGAIGQPATFSASITFSRPSRDFFRLEIFDTNPSTGQPIGTAVTNLRVLVAEPR